MHIRPFAVALILFGLLAIGCTIDRAVRKSLEQPLWMAENWRSALRGIVGWLVVGTLAVIGGIVAMIV
jgi:hypothetical protein